MENIKIVIDRSVLSRYEKVYFKTHPRAKKPPISNPYHESINQWMILPRVQMNALKQRWKDFIYWFMKDIGYDGMKINSCDIEVKTFYRINRRHDVDNSVIKFILDGFSESGFIVDDDYKHLKSLKLECGIDKNNPRTEIFVKNIGV